MKQEIKFILRIVLAFLIWAGFFNLFLKSTDPIRFYWEIVILSFALGTLMLTIRLQDLKKEIREPFPRLGFLVIISSIIILAANGLGAFGLQKANDLVGLIGIFFFSFCIAELFFVLGEHVISWK